MSQSDAPTLDPRTREAKPPMPKQEQQLPGLESKMTPAPDYGEKSYRGSGRLEGRKALITGGDSGIGRAVALAFAREGADVAISYLPEEESDARETERAVTEAGRKCLRLPGDIKDEAHCRSMIGRAAQELGGLDILVNNAAHQKTIDSISEMTSEEFDVTFRTNIYAMFYLAKAAVEVMKPGSAIINTASIQAYIPSPGLLAYAATKGAIVTFTKALAEQLTPKGIRVNAVAPGPVWTPLIPASMPAEQVKSFGESTPTKRPAQPVELAPVYVLLASNEASYISGEIYGVTGGKPLF